MNVALNFLHPDFLEFRPTPTPVKWGPAETDSYQSTSIGPKMREERRERHGKSQEGNLDN